MRSRRIPKNRCPEMVDCHQIPGSLDVPKNVLQYRAGRLLRGRLDSLISHGNYPSPGLARGLAVYCNTCVHADPVCGL